MGKVTRYEDLVAYQAADELADLVDEHVKGAGLQESGLLQSDSEIVSQGAGADR